MNTTCPGYPEFGRLDFTVDLPGGWEQGWEWIYPGGGRKGSLHTMGGDGWGQVP